MSSEGSSNYPAMAGAGGRKFSCGYLIELLRIGCAGLIFMDYNEERTITFVRKGEFVAKLIMQTISPILITACMVGDLHWPVTKDSPVIRVGRRSFAIAMPGLLYGLQFPRRCSEEMMECLERFFTRFAHYEDHSERENGIPWPDTERGFWPKSRSRIEEITHSKLDRFGHIPGRSPSAVGNQAKGFLRVVRTSAATQLITKVLVAGILKPAHIDINDMRAPQPQPQPDDDDEMESVHAYPTISVFTNIVEAVELSWVIASGDDHLLREHYPAPVEPLDFKVWNINRRGLVLLLHILSLVGKTRKRNKNENAEPTRGRKF